MSNRRENKKYKNLTEKQVSAIEAEVKLMLHAHRDCLRNQGQDTADVSFDVRDGYFGEAFGIMRTLQILNYGYFGACNTPESIHNLKWWFNQIEQQVLDEENFKGNQQCNHCLERYGRDGAGRSRSGLGRW